MTDPSIPPSRPSRGSIRQPVVSTKSTESSIVKTIQPISLYRGSAPLAGAVLENETDYTWFNFIVSPQFWFDGYAEIKIDVECTKK